MYVIRLFSRGGFRAARCSCIAASPALEGSLWSNNDDLQFSQTLAYCRTDSYTGDHSWYECLHSNVYLHSLELLVFLYWPHHIAMNYGKSYQFRLRHMRESNARWIATDLMATQLRPSCSVETGKTSPPSCFVMTSFLNLHFSCSGWKRRDYFLAAKYPTCWYHEAFE